MTTALAYTHSASPREKTGHRDIPLYHFRLRTCSSSPRIIIRLILSTYFGIIMINQWENHNVLSIHRPSCQQRSVPAWSTRSVPCLSLIRNYKLQFQHNYKPRLGIYILWLWFAKKMSVSRKTANQLSREKSYDEPPHRMSHAGSAMIWQVRIWTVRFVS